MARPRSSGTLDDKATQEVLAKATPDDGGAGRTQPGTVPAEPLVLPSEPTVPSGSMHDKTVFAYGPPKIGKSTLASEFPKILFFDTEGGLGDLSVYKVEVTDWPTFLRACAAATTSDQFDMICIDTVDMLASYCRQHVNRQLGILHESDLEWGKGWEITKSEFTRAVAKLAASNKGLLMLGHSETKEIKTRNQTWNKIVPALSPKGIRETVMGLSDLIFCIDMGEGDNGDDVRVIYTKESKYVEAGERGMTPRLPSHLYWPFGESGYEILTTAWEGKDAK